MLEGFKKINFKKYLIFFIYFFSIVIAAIVIDQVTKVVAMNCLTLGQPVTFIPNFIEFTLVYNKGAAFGMGDDALWIRIIFVLLSWLVAIGLLFYIGYLIYKDKKINPFFGVCLALILGGDIGNLIDIADSCLVVGILLLLGYLIYDEYKTSKEDKAHKEVVKKLEETEQNKVQEEPKNNE